MSILGRYEGSHQAANGGKGTTRQDNAAEGKPFGTDGFADFINSPTNVVERSKHLHGGQRGVPGGHPFYGVSICIAVSVAKFPQHLFQQSSGRGEPRSMEAEVKVET